MRTAVDRIGTGKVRQVNARFAAIASHYLFKADYERLIDVSDAMIHLSIGALLLRCVVHPTT